MDSRLSLAASTSSLPGYTPHVRYTGSSVPSTYPGSSTPTPDPASTSQTTRDALHRATSTSNPRINSPTSSRSSWVTERIEAWFGSVERFESSVVLATRAALVDCLTYPFIPFSRQCQLFLYSPAGVSMSAPFSTVVVMHNIMNTSGVPALWRGWRSHMMLMLVTPFIDALIVKLYRPRKSRLWNPLHVTSHFALQSIPYLVTMPLLSYTYMEMVQTTRDKLQESLWETFTHHSLFRQDELRRLPYITLATPTILYGLSSSLLHSAISYTVQRFLPLPPASSSTSVASTRSSPDSSNPLSSAMRGLWLDYFSRFITTVTLYPLQTILVRLYCQGMPALVDNVQSGTDSVYISSYYKGFVDCATGIWESEGFFGFFRGFSSLLLQYAIYGLILLFIWRTLGIVEKKYKNK